MSLKMIADFAKSLILLALGSSAPRVTFAKKGGILILERQLEGEKA